MPRIRFEPAGYETDVLIGDRLVDVTDAHPDAHVPYSCRSANCGTCRVKVEEGMGAFDPPDDDEAGTLDIFQDASDVRLCCQLKVQHDVPRIVLRVLEPQ